MSILSKLFPSRKRRDVDTLPVREKMAAIRRAKHLQHGRFPIHLEALLDPVGDTGRKVQKQVAKEMAEEVDALIISEWRKEEEDKLQKTIRAQGNALEMEQLIRDTLFHARRTLVSVGPEWLALEKRMEELLETIEGK